MYYQFPTINNISEVLPAIEGRDEFVVAVREGYTVINYNVMMSDTFPAVLTRPEEQLEHLAEDEYLCDYNAALRRECRGIIFCSKTGDIIRRPFHKFFNVNEREETQEHVVDLSREHSILEKLDGSMIAPFVVDGRMIWGTKMGATEVAEPVEDFVALNEGYSDYAWFMHRGGYTPIFEWCSRKQRIVLDYKKEQLILTAIRNMITGEYIPIEYFIAKQYGIPVVQEFAKQTDMKAFVEHTRGLEDVEGYVVRFKDGHMLKLKCDWYVQIHKAKEKILQDRNIVELILDAGLDDVKAHLPAEDRERLSQFEFDFNIEVASTCMSIEHILDGIAADGVDRKTFALEIAPNFNQYDRAAVFSCWDDKTKVYDTVRNTIRNNLFKTVKYEAIRDAWFKGVIYND